jgi:serine/threonine protein kinase
MTTIKYGMASFVELGKFKAKKHMNIEEMYWAREYSILLYLWKHKHSNIIQYESGSYLNRAHPMFNNDTIKCFIGLTFPKHKNTLAETSEHADKGIVQIIIDLLSAIKLCHSLNIWHRDIKQANILIQNGRATLIDFTHAVRIRKKEIILDHDVATCTHRAPEVFKYRRLEVAGYTEKIDVWALGIILFEMVMDDNLYEHLTQGDLDDLEDDLDDFFNGNSPEKVTILLKKIYDKKNRDLSHNQVYWTWINQMIEYNPDTRISASDMLDTIVQFATVNDIEFNMPTNRDVIPTICTYSNLEPEQKKLLDVVYAIARELNKHLRSTVKIVSFVPIYKMLIATGSINRENMLHMTLATFMLVINIVGDRLVNVDEVISMFASSSNLCFKKQPLISALISIMQNNETDLFLHDTFKF